MTQYSFFASLLALAAAAPRLAAAGKPINDHSRGGKLYSQNCASCHMADGGGMAHLQPSLLGDPILAADSPDQLIDVILRGPAAVLPADRPHFPTTMPAFGGWPDRDVADVATFLRKVLADKTAPVTPAQVAARRSQ